MNTATFCLKVSKRGATPAFYIPFRAAELLNIIPGTPCKFSLIKEDKEIGLKSVVESMSVSSDDIPEWDWMRKFIAANQRGLWLPLTNVFYIADGEHTASKLKFIPGDKYDIQFIRDNPNFVKLRIKKKD